MILSNTTYGHDKSEKAVFLRQRLQKKIQALHDDRPNALRVDQDRLQCKMMILSRRLSVSTSRPIRYTTWRGLERDTCELHQIGNPESFVAVV